MSRRGGHRPRCARHEAVSCDITNFAIMSYHKIRKGLGVCFVCTCAHPLASSGAANTGDTGAPEGDLPQREKHPPTTLERSRDLRVQGIFYSGRFLWREVIRDHRESFQARARRDDDTSSVVDGCAEPSVDGMASRESGVMAWRHRIRRRRARLAPSSRPKLP